MTAAAVVLLPLLAGPLVWALGARYGPRSLGGACTATLIATLVLAVAAALSGSSAAVAWGAGLALTLSADGVAGVVAVLVAGVGAAVVAYAAVHEPPASLPRLLGLLVAFVGIMELLVLADDLLTLLIAWELSAAVSWALISSDWSDDAAVGMAGHAFNTTRAGSLGLVLAAGASIAGSGSLAYDSLATLDGRHLAVVAGGVVFAAASKSAQVPFAPWLYSAMAGPTPVSALLHSATMVAAGAYALIRLGEPLSAVGWFQPLVVGVGLTTALAGGVLALCETHAKKILAASTSAQYGLMFVAVGVGAAGAAAVHLVAHGLFKALLFLAAGVGLHATGTSDVRQWRLGRRVPVVAWSAAVGAAALAAVPPLGGAWTKGQIAAAALEAAPSIGWLTLAAGLLSAAYAGRLHLLAFGRGEADAAHSGGQPPFAERATVVVLAAASVMLGALWLPPAWPFVESVTGSAVVHEGLAKVALSALLVAAGLGWAWLVTRDVDDPSWYLPSWFTRSAAGWFGIPTATGRVVVEPTLALAAALARWDDAVMDAPARAIGGAARRAATALPRFDDRVVDMGPAAVSRLARATSDALARVVERGVDGAVSALAAATEWLGDLSRVGDDRGVDGAVEGLARAVGASGRRSRALQSGLAHHYYVIAVIGLAAVVAVAAFGR